MSDASDGSLVLRELLLLPLPYVAPRTATEERLERIWRSVLRMDCVGVEDSYNDLGGDSFLAAVIFDLIEQEFGSRINIATLISAPTIAELARRIDHAARGSGA